MRGAALPLLLIVSACGRGPSRADLQDRIARLEDENDTLKQQLGEAQDQLEDRRIRRTRAAREARHAPPSATDSNRPAHAARLEREMQGTAYPRPPKPPSPPPPAQPTREAQNAAAQALIAATDARKALAQR